MVEVTALLQLVAWLWEFIPENPTLTLSSALKSLLAHLITVINSISASAMQGRYFPGQKDLEQKVWQPQ